jgi:hypothetical protein
MELLDYLRAQREGLAADRLGIGHFASAYARELPIQKIGPHFALEHAEAPVADAFAHVTVCLSSSKRSTISAGVPSRPRARLLG